MAKAKDNTESVADPQADRVADLQADRDRAVEGREILQQFLDWCGKNFARVTWFKNGRGETFVRISVDHMEVQQAYSDPIEGALEAMALMDARMVRRQVNAGI